MISSMDLEVVRRVIAKHDIKPAWHNFDRLFKAFQKELDAGVAPKGVQDAMGTVQRALWRQETMTSSQFIAPGMKALFNVDI